jgi:Ser/Thr protein kinase RdoA (MazF antagonist)
MFDPLLAFADSVLESPVTTIGDQSWPDGKSRVVELADGTGRRWFAKHHRDREWYTAECQAYDRWVPALGDRAPSLRARDDTLAALLLSAVPSDGHKDWRDEVIRRDGGAVLRTLHDAEAFGPWNNMAEEKQVELEFWTQRGSGLFDRQDLDFAQSCVRALGSLPAPDRVPCHRDYTPRNWVIARGRVHVVDFEETRPEAWMTDLGRMAIGWWRHEPDLMYAVLEGYGRMPSDDEVAIMRCSYAVTAVRHVVLGSELGKAEFVASTRVLVQELRMLLS